MRVNLHVTGNEYNLCKIQPGGRDDANALPVGYFFGLFNRTMHNALLPCSGITAIERRTA